MGDNGRHEATIEERERHRSRRFIRRGAGRAHGDPSADGGLAGLQAELMLLREENARLSQERHQPPRVAGLLRQAGARTAPEAIADDPGDELAQLLTDYTVMRETLLVACEEMERSLSALRARLAALPEADLEPGRVNGDAANGSSDAAVGAPGALPWVGDGELS